jgi:hypothetical protein
MSPNQAFVISPYPIVSFDEIHYLGTINVKHQYNLVQEH